MIQKTIENSYITKVLPVLIYPNTNWGDIQLFKISFIVKQIFHYNCFQYQTTCRLLVRDYTYRVSVYVKTYQ